ncbi:MAG TPA: chemotaxis protein CheB [Longimicrobium sp.]|nr:chemotaxis protein CheB [Longimicrobium sp.]
MPAPRAAPHSAPLAAIGGSAGAFPALLELLGALPRRLSRRAAGGGAPAAHPPQRHRRPAGTWWCAEAHHRGGTVIAQDAAGARHHDMPAAAIAAGAVSHVTSPAHAAELMMKLLAPRP